MINVEELVDIIVDEEGQNLLGLDFLMQTLGLDMQKWEKIFIKAVREYERRRPLKTTEILTGDGQGMILMPPGTMGVRSVRYGVLPEFPRYFQEDLGQTAYSYEPQTRLLRVYPPLTPIKVTYLKGYTISGSSPSESNFPVFAGDTGLTEYLNMTYRPNSFNLVLGSYSLQEVGRESITVNEEGTTYNQTVSRLEGTLGTGTFNLNTKELDITFGSGIIVDTESVATCTYIPTYKSVLEIGIGDYVFTKLFASKFLEAVASARAQATQAEVYSIDLTEDQLYMRARMLKKESKELMKQTFDYGAVADT